MELKLRTSNYIDWKVYSITSIKNKYGFRVKLIYGEKDVDVHQHAGYRTKKEATDKRNEIIFQLTNHTYVVYANIKVIDYYSYWLDEIMKTNITFNTYASYKNIVYNYIISEYGNLKMTTLNQSHIRKLYNSVATKSESVVRLVKTVMNTSLEHAVQRNVISTNVALDINLPKSIKKKEYRTLNIDSQNTLNIEQVKTLIKASKDTPIHLQVMFGVLMGMRISEINGLKYSDIDYINRKIFIERQLGKDLSKDNIECRKKTITKQEVKVKTKSSKRWVDIPDILFEEILEQRKIYEKNRKRRINDKTFPFRDDNYICCSTYGNSRSRQFHRTYYNKLLLDNNLPAIKFHDLRHTYATILLKSNFSSKAVSQLLGHSSEIITVDVYCDKKQLIYDCLNVLEPFIEEVIPQEETIYDYSDIDMGIDEYMNNILP